MSGIHYLKAFDKSQFWRFFVDGRFQKKYDGWVGYEAGERGSVQALLNGFSFMMDNFDISNGLKATYLRELHKVCMLSVATTNLKSSPGDIRYLNSGMPFFAKSTTYEHLVEVFEMRKDDGTAIFNSAQWGKTANELDVDEVYQVMLKDGKINYRNWYPNIDVKQQQAIDSKLSLHEFYEAKHSIQMLMVSKMQEIVDRYNKSIKKAKTDEEKLRAIALVPRELELLHPFPDGNSRTFSCVTLTHLLTFNGFSPALLENPNLDNEVSLSQWIEEVKSGMQRTKTLIENPDEKLFSYSILDMSVENREKFTEMASELSKKIDNHKEIFLTPTKLVKYTNGAWIDEEVNENLYFSGVGTYGTYQKGNIYFTMSIKDWIKEGKDVESELNKVLSVGIKAVVLDNLEYAPLINVPILHVKDCFEAFKKCAIEVRQEHNPYTVLVTGTEGKTGAKVQFHHILNAQVKTHAVLNSANTEVPVLRSLINLENDDVVEINEVSVGADEAYRVERTMMVNPDLCFFTNIGPNHMDLHKNIDNIMTAKSSVVEGLREGGKCILNSEIEHYPKLLEAIYKRRPNTPILTYGTKKQDSARLIKQTFESKRFGWNIKADIDGWHVEYFLPLFQQHAPLASVGILLALKEMGYDVLQAAKDYEGLVPFETMGRMLSIKKQSGYVHFYDQSRRGGMHGMRSAFNDMKNFKLDGKIVALVGGISINKDSDWTKESHAELAKMINESKIDRLYTTGNYMDYVTSALSKPEILVKHSDDLDDLAQSLFNEVQGGDLLFIIGSAYLYLGRVSDKILKLKDESKFDREIFNYSLPKKSLETYKALIVLDEIENKNTLETSLIKNELDSAKFHSITKNSPTFKEIRANVLINFFNSLSKIVLKNKSFRLVNDEIESTGNKTYVFNKEYCKDWFNNLDKNPNLAKKQLFGNFYDFGNDNYLWHVEVATKNLHVGFVKYTKEDGKFKAIKMSKDDFKDVKEMCENKFGNQILFEERSWGLGWFTHDSGTIIDLTKAENFVLMMDLEHSDFCKNILLPILKKI
ncbi:MAG: Mur ligase family protein [Sulfurimonas sp.]|jgi:UDP-N-acetylmuramyl pentapeptide synthase/fido (protein-threonine AMPylation protein)